VLRDPLAQRGARPRVYRRRHSGTSPPPQRNLEAMERYPVGSEGWAEATAYAFDMLRHEECAEVAKPEWWNDEELKALSARVVRAAPNALVTNQMRGIVCCAGVMVRGRRGLARQRSSRRRPRTTSRLRRCAMLRW